MQRRVLDLELGVCSVGTPNKRLRMKVRLCDVFCPLLSKGTVIPGLHKEDSRALMGDRGKVDKNSYHLDNDRVGAAEDVQRTEGGRIDDLDSWKGDNEERLERLRLDYGSDRKVAGCHMADSVHSIPVDVASVVHVDVCSQTPVIRCNSVTKTVELRKYRFMKEMQIIVSNYVPLQPEIN